ncbi:MAG: glycogen debranching protein [Muribaculaceae bacterium]|nr:glycogen debranching protein [Muribaculaceae bacterium]
MKKLIVLLALSTTLSGFGRDIFSNEAYRWTGDTIVQGEYRAWAPNDYELISTYSAQPHFFMPIEKSWKAKNDLSSYPRLKSDNRLHNALYNLALDEMVNAVEPDTTLRTGKEWAGVWTRDVSYSIILSMAYMQPLASKVSLMKKVNANGRIIQDTGSGGAWPVSSDRMIWTVAAYELYKVTGDRKWLEYIYPIIRNSFEDDFLTVYAPDGLVKGETSFIDWREQSHPQWMQTADIYQTEALNTSLVHAIGLNILSEIAAELGHKAEAKKYAEASASVAKAINEHLWMDDKGYYGMYLYGRDNLIMNPRAETLGESLSILYDIAPSDRQRSITENNPTTPYGAAIFYPQIADMPAYHNNALWPWVGAMWGLANAKAGNEQGTLQAIGAVFRPAALFTTNKENFNLDNGDIATELNSSNMLWCLAGNLALTYRVLFGIHFEKDGLLFSPFVPKALAGTRSLDGFPWRNASLDITISGYGNQIKSFRLNGKEHSPLLPPTLKGNNKVEIVMADNEIAPMKVNNVPNLKAPLTPVTTLCYTPDLPSGNGVPVNNLLTWKPIEYIGHYIVLRDGKPVAETNMTSFDATVPGEYQVIGVATDGTPSFASAPLSNRPAYVYEMPGETTVMASAEVSYQPKKQIVGYHGNGFVEVDHKTAPISLDVEVPEDGIYSIDVVYANGNGPVNTENKCAIRTLTVDNKRAGVLVMPHRGVANWDEWGLSNPVQVSLTKGKHNVKIDYRPENENMNLGTNHALIDRLRLTRVR